MLPAWRLAINSVSARRSRAALLAATVALAAAMIAAVACAMSSLNHAVEQNVAETVGKADLRVTPSRGGRALPRSLLDEIRAWPEVAAATGQIDLTMPLEHARPWWGPVESLGDGDSPDTKAALTDVGLGQRERKLLASAVALGIDPAAEQELRPRRLIEGRWPANPGEIAVDELLAGRLSRIAESGSIVTQLSRLGRGEGQREFGPRPPTPPAIAADARTAAELNRAFDLRAGDEVRWLRLLRKPHALRVVGIIAQPPMGARAQVYALLDDLATLAGKEGELSRIEILLKPGYDEAVLAEAWRSRLPRGAVIVTGEKTVSALQQNMEGNRITYAVISTMAFLGASFIIMTGLSTAVTERQRELAVLRCIGGSRAQLAYTQLAIGGIIGVVGAIIGLPLGIAIAALVVDHFKAEIPTGVRLSPTMLAWAGLGAAGSAVVGAFFPAWMAARVSPLAALAARAKPASRVAFFAATIAACILVPLHLASIFLPSNQDVAFWLYVTVGIPALVTGYFLISVPVTRIVASVFGGAVSGLLGAPRGMATRSVQGAPFKFGFTAGAMSFGLALMVGIWTQGDSILRDWLAKLKFPEAFVVGLNLTPQAQEKLEQLPFVTRTCAVSLLPVETDVFGLKGLTTYTSTFIAFEVEPFFEMTNLEWVEGDPSSAREQLSRGGAVLVAREFKAAKGLSVGDTLTCRAEGRTTEFRIVGVVHSPGLDVVSQAFTIGQDYTDQSVNAIFGTRRDLKEKFGSEAIQLIQIGLMPDDKPGAVDDDAAVATIRRELFTTGILEVGSARKLMKDVRTFIERTLLISSSIGIFALATAGLGVANIIIAGIAARRFEFGVLRAVGASRWTVARVVLAEVLLVSISACIIGSVCGLQGAVGGQRLQRILFGFDMSVSPPLRAIGAGCCFVFVVSLCAAGPALVRLARRSPRELLAAMRG